MKLSQKLLLAVLPVLGLVLSLGGWLLIRQDFTASLAAMQRQAETEQLRERSALQAELLSADVDPVLYLPEYGAAVDRYTGGERAFALFSDSGVLAYSAMPQQVQLAWQLALLDADGGMLRTAADGSRWYLIADRIPVRETAVYYVGAYPMDTAYNTQAMLLASYFWIELAVFAAAGLAVWFMIHRLTRPLRALDAAGANVALRCPIIPGVNDTDAHFAAIRALKAQYACIQSAEIMAYHDIGKTKWEALGKPYALAALKTVSPEQKRLWEAKIAD